MHKTLHDIASATGATLRGSLALADRSVSILLTDSRSLISPEDSLFFAIRSAGNDGHRFIRDLFSKGVRAFVVNEIPDGMENCGALWLVVPDTVEALQRTGGMHGGREVVGITGSRGKTTLKEWLFQLMEPLTDIVRSPRSFNSQIGVPLSAWNITPETSLAIIEAGISRPGEMRRLAEVIRPDTMIFTNIGDAHDAGFPSREVKAAEKALLAAGECVKRIIYCADYEVVAHALAPYLPGKDAVGWSTGDAGARLFIDHIHAEDGARSRCRFVWRAADGSRAEGSIRFPSGHEGDLENAANALAFMLSAGWDTETVQRRFDSLSPIGTRLNVSEGVNGCSLIFDSYTSDLSSLGPALDFLRRRCSPTQTRTLILSDLRHESLPRADVYRAIADMVRAEGISRFIGIGPRLCAHRDAFAPESRFFDNTDEMLASLAPEDFSNEIILFKGAPEFGFMRIFEALEARKHETVLEVNLDAIVSNFNWFRSLLPPSTGLVCMVKASGYGAGSFEIARTLQDCGAAYLAVAVLDEGIELRRKGISMPIMVMNPRVVNYKTMFTNRLEPEIYSAEMLADVIRAARRAGITRYPIHIKLDTGMHRTGFIEEELPALMDTILAQDSVELRSVFSHLATADCLDMDDYTELQLDRFARYTDYILSRSPRPVLRHVLNSAGIVRFPGRHYELARLGIGLYGVNTLPPQIEKKLRTVSTLRTVIIAVREYPAGETIGYGRRGVLTRRSRIATIPIGYADGMNRMFGRGAVTVRINGHDCPTIGNICMDSCMIDVTGVECRTGDSVEIFGPEAPVQRLADVAGTIPYEILTSVSPRVKRIYYRE